MRLHPEGTPQKPPRNTDYFDVFLRPEAVANELRAMEETAKKAEQDYVALRDTNEDEEYQRKLATLVSTAEYNARNRAEIHFASTNRVKIIILYVLVFIAALLTGVTTCLLILRVSQRWLS
jgi:hypothetical protein